MNLHQVYAFVHFICLSTFIFLFTLCKFAGYVQVFQVRRLIQRSMAPNRIIGKTDGRHVKGGLVLRFGKSNIILVVKLVDVG